MKRLISCPNCGYGHHTLKKWDFYCDSCGKCNSKINKCEGKEKNE